MQICKSNPNGFLRSFISVFWGVAFGALVTLASLAAVPVWAQNYPAGFIWGAAFSAHQTEGVTGGGESGDWWQFEHPAQGVISPIANGDTADVATDFWNRYPEDIAIAKKMGLTTLRTSLAWEKIEPVRGQFNFAAIEHYRKIFLEMRAQGIRPMIALHHFTHPTWFHQLGGWENAASPWYFLDYTKFVVSHLKDVCDLWISFNEPMILVQMGYLKKDIPPQKGNIDSGFEAAWNLARAHRLFAAEVHKQQGVPNNSDKNKPVRGVGIAYAFTHFEPADLANPMDRLAVEKASEIVNWAWLQGAVNGRLQFDVPFDLLTKKYLRDLPESDLNGYAKGPHFDWMGANYYSRWILKFNPASSLKVDWLTPPGPQSDCGWSIYAPGLHRVLMQMSKRFGQIPLLVTENGLADGADTKRPDFIRDHLASVDRALNEGADLRGYYHWSLTDNFEWASGYMYRFGLVEIDYQNNLARKPRGSFEVYRQEMLKRTPRLTQLWPFISELFW